MSFRLSSGGMIDRSRTLTFTFNRRRLTGHPGDTLASALIANGVRVIGRSFKYHRPRGFFGSGLEDPNAIVSVRDGYGYDPALRAGTVVLAEGLETRTVGGWPSQRFDTGALASLAAPLLRSGFYYKTFKWPSWRWYEGAIRRCTGFGRPRSTADTRRSEHCHHTCDVLVVGAGAAGLAAADALAESGLRIVVADDQPQPGGSLLWEEGTVDGLPARTWAGRAAGNLQAAGVRLLSSTTVVGAYEGNFFVLVETFHDDSGVPGERLWKVRARHVIMATGAVDRPVVFQNNDRPGVMLSSAVRRYMAGYGVAPGAAVAVHTTNDSGYLTAITAHRAGVRVPVLVDARGRKSALHAELLESMGIHCVFNARIEDTTGHAGVKNITVTGDGERRRYDCDVLAVAGGWTPLIHLAAQRGARPHYDASVSMFLCPELPAGWQVAGGAGGALSLSQALLSGHAAGQAIARSGRPPPQGECEIEFEEGSPLWRTANGKAAKMWVDLQNDVTAADIALAVRENYVSVEHLKRYTTLGMGTDQGRTSNVNGLALLAGLSGREIEEVGTTTFRPPYAALRFGTIAHTRQHDAYLPRRRMPAHDVHAAAGAIFEDLGWERPDWYRCNGRSREEAVMAECRAVREAVGIFDGSPLGKIEVAGPDARIFLDRFYVSNLSTLSPGRLRYSVMLKEDGVIFDDGVVACIDDTLFIASPTSGNADAVAAWFERWHQTEWPDLKVAIAPVTSNWASIALAGPGARDLMESLDVDFDISNEAFPHMRIRQGRVAGVPARVARVSFTGELQYEVSVPARYGHAAVEAAVHAGSRMGARLVGVEAWLRLRVEKGYMHVGTDTNGQTTPLDIGMDRVVARKRADFIGKRSLGLATAADGDREQLVGLRSTAAPLEVGARVLEDGGSRPPCNSIGCVTSAYSSPASGHIAMALIRRGRSRMGERVHVYSGGRVREAEVCPAAFLDPANERLAQ